VLSPPSNYDDPSLLIQIDPNSLFLYATVNLVNAGTVISDLLNAVFGVWNNLTSNNPGVGGWVGDTANQVQDFSTRCNNACQLMFGTQADPDSGAFTVMANALADTAINFGEAEDTNQKMFLSFINGINSPPGNPPPPARNDYDAPITETAPASS
jgi:hypothetical protein